MKQRNNTAEEEFLKAEIAADETAVTFDVRKPLAPKGCVRFPNGVRPTIQFVDETTESRLKDIREQMTFTKAKNTIRRTGWYYTEPGTPCGEYMTTEEIKTSIADVFGA